MIRRNLFNAALAVAALSVAGCDVDNNTKQTNQTFAGQQDTLHASQPEIAGVAQRSFLTVNSNMASTECTGFLAFPGAKRWVPALPDKASRYDSYAFKPDTGDYDAIVVTGEFPYARYFSLNLYDFDAGNNIGALPDYLIEPDAGHTNPYRPGADRTATARSFTIYMVRAGSGFVPPTGASVIELPAGIETISVITRVYRPDQGRDDLGGVDRPALYVLHSGSSAECPDGGMDLDSLVGIADLIFFPDTFIESRDTIAGLQGSEQIFVRADGTGLFPNADNEYVFSPLKSSGVSVFRFKPPTFEDTYGGSTVFGGGTQTRYWSVCIGGLAATQTSSCLEDDRARIDGDGFVTVVVGPESVRGITEDAGLNFLNRGLVYKPIIIHRHMLDASGFSGSIAAAPKAPQELPGGFDRSDLDELDVRGYMGDFAPYGESMSTLRYRLWLRLGQIIS